MEWIEKGNRNVCGMATERDLSSVPVRFLPVSTVLYFDNKVAFLKAIMETELFICRGLFWTSTEEESYRFSLQYHEQPNVLGINNELLGILIKVKVSLFFLRQIYPLLKAAGCYSTNGTN